LRNYQHSQGNLTSKAKKTRVTGIFAILGAALGFAIFFFASGNTTWLAFGTIIGGLVGFLVGRAFDRQYEKK
jgi:hypothetical protein